MLRTRSPLAFKCIATAENPFDLHVLTTPPAFILSQDQTLRKKRARILVIHELLENPSSEDDRTRIEIRVLEYVDWGSQSIAQSKFQRTVPYGGKDFQEDIWNFFRQYFSRNFPKKVLGRNARLSGPLIVSPALRREVLTEGTAENANGVFLIKTFLLGILAINASNYKSAIYSSLFPRRHPRFQPRKRD